MPTSPAILVLADGTILRGISIGAPGSAVGEVVFNTAITGYQEILTDPSYCNQIVTLTYPHIGNTGINAEDVESARICAAGLVIRELSLTPSNWRHKITLSEYLQQQGVVGIAGVDTRKLTRILRDKGAQAGCLMAGRVDEAEALAKARAFPGLAGMDLAKVVTRESSESWDETEWTLDAGYGKAQQPKRRVIAFDYGVKRNILRKLATRGCDVIVLPAQTSAREALAHAPDGIFLSSGPGDPEPCDYAIEAIRDLLGTGIPIFGICLGHQLLGLAAGARTRKMKFGHHGANHPVLDVQSKRVLITSQNHGFEVAADTLPDNVDVTHVSLFDGSLQGFAFKDRPAFCFQGHPEASPGPHDVDYLFDRFVAMMKERRTRADHAPAH